MTDIVPRTSSDPQIFSRPTSYKGVLMRSRLEAAWAEQFDALSWAWEYEPLCLAGAQGQYLPDFRITLPNNPQPLYWEVKGGWWEKQQAGEANYEAVLGRTRQETNRMAQIVHEHDPRAVFIVAQVPEWTECHVLTAVIRGGAHEWHCAICRCEEGCTSVVKYVPSVCNAHHLPWVDVDLVASLHAQQFGRINRAWTDPVASEIDMSRYRPGLLNG